MFDKQRMRLAARRNTVNLGKEAFIDRLAASTGLQISTTDTLEPDRSLKLEDMIFAKHSVERPDTTSSREWISGLSWSDVESCLRRMAASYEPADVIVALSHSLAFMFVAPLTDVATHMRALIDFDRDTVYLLSLDDRPLIAVDVYDQEGETELRFAVRSTFPG